jgi:hypothetical protein
VSCQTTPLPQICFLLCCHINGSQKHFIASNVVLRPKYYTESQSKPLDSHARQPILTSNHHYKKSQYQTWEVHDSCIRYSSNVHFLQISSLLKYAKFYLVRALSIAFLKPIPFPKYKKNCPKVFKKSHATYAIYLP